jgi:hypothetical protein
VARRRDMARDQVFAARIAGGGEQGIAGRWSFVVGRWPDNSHCGICKLQIGK